MVIGDPDTDAAKQEPDESVEDLVDRPDSGRAELSRFGVGDAQNAQHARGHEGDPQEHLDYPGDRPPDLRHEGRRDHSGEKGDRELQEQRHFHA